MKRWLAFAGISKRGFRLGHVLLRRQNHTQRFPCRGIPGIERDALLECFDGSLGLPLAEEADAGPVEFGSILTYCQRRQKRQGNGRFS